jgi:hypothetical protein
MPIIVLMELVFTHSRMALRILGMSLEALQMAWALTTGLMGRFMLGNGKMEGVMGSALIPSLMAHQSRVDGRLINMNQELRI